MTEEKNKSTSNGSKPETALGSLVGPIFACILLGAIAFRFIVQLSDDGWGVASKQNPGGAILFVLACVGLYIVLAEQIYTKVDKSCGKAMGWILALVIAFFILGEMPSCSSSPDQEQGDIYYRK